MVDLSRLAGYHSRYGIPAYVKDAAVSAGEDLTVLPRRAFADESRKLPVHTKSATWLSHLEFYDRPGEFSQEAKTGLEKNAAFWGIEFDCLALRQNLVKEAAVTAPAADDYALFTDELQLFPIRNEEEVKQAAADFVTHRADLPYALRSTAARAILKKADALKLELGSEEIEKSAGYGIGTTDAALALLHDRSRRCKSAECKEKLKQLEDCINDPELNPSKLDKLAFDAWNGWGGVAV